jgi:hypothetical protein
MPINFSCLNCQTTYCMPDRAAGRKGTCRHCRQRLEVPKAPTPTPPPPPHTSKTVLGKPPSADFPPPPIRLPAPPPVRQPAPTPTPDLEPPLDSLPTIDPYPPARPRVSTALVAIAITAMLAVGVGFMIVVIAIAVAPPAPGERAPLLDPAPHVTAQDLFDAFRADREAAGKRYYGRVLVVTGPAIGDPGRKPVKTIDFFVQIPNAGFERPADTWRRIAAATASGVNGVRCHFSSPVPLPGAGEHIRVRGRCVQSGYYDAVLRDCTLLRP